MHHGTEPTGTRPPQGPAAAADPAAADPAAADRAAADRAGAAADPSRYGEPGAAFLGVRADPGGDADRWALPLHAGLTGGKGGLFGGCGVGAAITGLEARTGRPLRWITTQFLAPAAPPDVLRFSLSHLVAGRNVAQAVVAVEAGDAPTGRPVLAVLAALGSRADGDERRYLPPPPAVPPPGDCPAADHLGGGGGLRPRFDIRAVPAPAGAAPAWSGRSRWWVGAHGSDVATAELLAVAVDFVPFSLTAALERPVFGASLDNTLRLVERAEAEWILVDTAVEAITAGIGQVSARVWAPDGRLLALAAQTCVVSERRPG